MNSRNPLIGFNASFYTPRRVGINTVIRSLAAELSREWQLVIYTAYPGDFAELPVRFRPIPRWTSRFYLRFFWNQLSLPALIRQDKLDLFLSPVPELPSSLSIPALAVIHDLTPLVLPGSSRLHHTTLFRWSTHMLGAASCLVAVSRHTLEDIDRMRLYPDKPRQVIYNGTHFLDLVDGPGFANAPARPYLLYVGGFLPHKNVPLLITAFHELAQEIPHQLVLAGWGPERIMRPLRALITALGIQGRIILRHDVPDPELAELYRHCDLFIYPSRYEGFGLPVLEAMACGAPVLSSDAASLPEVGGDAVTYFAPDSRDQLVAKIRDLLADPARRRESAEKGRVRARAFTWERAAREFSDLIRQTIQSGDKKQPTRQH